VREVAVGSVVELVENLFLKANYSLPPDMLDALSNAAAQERADLASSVLKTMKENANVAAEGIFPLCQDCGMAVLFVDVGQNVHFIDGDLTEALNEGVRRAYSKGYLRKSIVDDPLFK